MDGNTSRKFMLDHPHPFKGDKELKWYTCSVRRWTEKIMSNANGNVLLDAVSVGNTLDTDTLSELQNPQSQWMVSLLVAKGLLAVPTVTQTLFIFKKGHTSWIIVGKMC